MSNRLKFCSMAAMFSLVFSTQILAGNDEPIILKQPENISQCIGGTEKLTMTLNEGIKAKIQWQTSMDVKHWNNVEGAIESSFTPDSKMAKVMWYRVAVTTEGKESHTSLTTPVKVEVVELPKVDIVIPSKDNISIGSPINMKVVRTGGAGECTYQWQTAKSGTNNWTDLEGETKEEFTTPLLSKDVLYRAKTVCTGSGCCNK
jgi:hypothetical protein